MSCINDHGVVERYSNPLKHRVCVCTAFSCRKQLGQVVQPLTGKSVSSSNTVWISIIIQLQIQYIQIAARGPVPLEWYWTVVIFPRILDKIPVKYISCLHNCNSEVTFLEQLIALLITISRQIKCEDMINLHNWELYSQNPSVMPILNVLQHMGASGWGPLRSFHSQSTGYSSLQPCSTGLLHIVLVRSMQCPGCHCLGVADTYNLGKSLPSIFPGDMSRRG